MPLRRVASAVNLPLLVFGTLLLVILAGFIHWQINLAEGVYLGRRVVIWLYDRFAPRYDVVKQFNETDEAWFLGWPLAQALHGVTTSIVLDVATGTARLPLALFRQQTFTGRVIGLDLSREMLRRAAENTAAYQDRLTLLWQDGTQLPFPNNTFDAVACLEALEFLPDSRATLAEMTRVLRAGGIFLTSNRIGPGERWMPGRTMDRSTLTAFLESLGLENIRIAVWQVDYDIVWAQKSLPETPSDTFTGLENGPATLPFLLRCPRCTQIPMARQDDAFYCANCDRRYPIAEDGVLEFGF